jgi:hypothetical protein
MSTRRIKRKAGNGPLDWIRTDDDNMVECFYIQLLTRGLYPVLEALAKALELERRACIEQKAQLHPGWLDNAEFCKRASEHLKKTTDDLQAEWNAEDPEEIPNTAKRKEPVIGGLYPLPGGGLYIPKR